MSTETIIVTSADRGRVLRDPAGIAFTVDDKGIVESGGPEPKWRSVEGPFFPCSLPEGWRWEEKLVSAASSSREPFGGRYFGIWNVEGEGEPLALFSSEAAAARELDRRRALPEDDDDRLTEYHQVFPADLIGAWWNSYESDPRADDPLTHAEIVAVQGGR